ncbi:phosphopantetheine adenylyltransferase [Candidatus Geothermarchaeota archaeon]|nr:MAG: phosphopantetheine adenylyltransferase [Candidatus Geothermarchaeota archaeon]HEW93547.1 pantetheine-phosphate adenylyltransferase [Thermoprotei archaeon]
MATVILGGTFEELHGGHVKLLIEAINLGDRILIGLTSDSFARSTKRRDIIKYEKRKENLVNLLKSIRKASGKHIEIFKIDDPYGPAIELEDIDIIVVSTETYPRAKEINEIRVLKGLKPLAIYVINLVETKEGEKISSTHVRVEKYDSWGRRLS